MNEHDFENLNTIKPVKFQALWCDITDYFVKFINFDFIEYFKFIKSNPTYHLSCAVIFTYFFLTEHKSSSSWVASWIKLKKVFSSISSTVFTKSSLKNNLVSSANLKISLVRSGSTYFSETFYNEMVFSYDKFPYTWTSCFAMFLIQLSTSGSLRISNIACEQIISRKCFVSSLYSE